MKLEGTFAPTRKQDGPVGGGAAGAFVALPGQEVKKDVEPTAPGEKVVAGMKRGRDEDDEGAKEGEGRGSEGPAGVGRKEAEKKEADEEEEEEDEGEEMEMDEDDD